MSKDEPATNQRFEDIALKLHELELKRKTYEASLIPGTPMERPMRALAEMMEAFVRYERAKAAE